MALLTYEAIAELCRLAGSKKDWPEVKRLGLEWLQDLTDIREQDIADEERKAEAAEEARLASLGGY